MMVFKTNYRNLDLARYKANCLKRTIDYFKTEVSDSDIVWKDTKNLDFFTRQYDNEYESIKFIKNKLKDLLFETICDIGCGSGSLCFYLSKIMNIEYTGIDINERVLKIAKKYNKNSTFLKDNILNPAYINYLKQKDLIISNQVLNIISPDKQNKFINIHFKYSKKYVVFFSLFTDSELEINIKINDPYNDEIVYYNIVPVNKIKKIAKTNNFNIESIDNFDIKKKIDKPFKKGRNTYTMETKNGKLLQFSDVIYMPWKLIILKKS
jgi:SAM-dependent methyltransferase